MMIFEIGEVYFRSIFDAKIKLILKDCREIINGKEENNPGRLPGSFPVDFLNLATINKKACRHRHEQ